MKTAFNTLAYFKEKEFVLHERYDKLRDSILSLNNLENFILLKSEIPLKVTKFHEELPEKAHSVIIEGNEDGIKGYVSFYKEKPGIVLLDLNYEGEAFSKAIVVDWKNTRETIYDRL